MYKLYVITTLGILFYVCYVIFTMVKNKRGGKICAFCSKTNRMEGISVHIFPNPEKSQSRPRFKAWVAALKLMRNNWDYPANLGKETKTWHNTVICSDHFKASDYVEGTNRLKADAMPVFRAIPIFRPSSKKPTQRSTATSARCQNNVSYTNLYSMLNFFIINI